MILNIQRYLIHGGPGICTIVFLKGCSLDCHWCQNLENRARTQDLLYDMRPCLEGCELYAKAAPEVIERALNGLLIRREKLISEYLMVLTDCCPTQTLTVCGKMKSTEEIVTTILCDKPFYDHSGGGLTPSGGEPFMQSEMAMMLLQASHEAGIHTAAETCLHASWKYTTPFLPYTDLFLAGLEHVTDASSRQWTDDNVARVLDSPRKPTAAGKKITICAPPIQGFNADGTSIKVVIDFAADELHAGEIHSLPYHTLGINKYHLFSPPYDVPEKPLDTSELLDPAQQYAYQKGLTAILRG